MAEENAPAGAAAAPEKTFTQADLDRVVGERLARDREKFADYDTLKTAAKELADLKASQQSETEKLTGKAAKLETESAATKAENLRLRVAMNKKLPADLIDRMHGSTKEELEADADKLLELVKPTPSLDGGARQGATTASDLDSMIRRAAGRS